MGAELGGSFQPRELVLEAKVEVMQGDVDVPLGLGLGSCDARGDADPVLQVGN
jgi:hypothetical protein